MTNPPKGSPAQSSALDWTTPILCSSVFQRPTLRSCSGYKILWRASLLVYTATRYISILATLHWLPINWRIDFKVATIAHKLLSTGQPSYLASSISPHAPCRSLRSSDFGSLYVPRTKLVTGERAFRSTAPSVWNRLPADIRNSASIHLFRNKIKTHFYRLVFN